MLSFGKRGFRCLRNGTGNAERLLGLGGRQGDGNRRSLADLGRDIQRTAVHGNDFLRHGKADAAAALLG